MNGKPLSETNLYLRQPEQYKKLLLINIGSSTAIELGFFPNLIKKELKALYATRRPKRS